MVEKREYVNYKIKDRIVIITVDRPPMNALNPQVGNEIKEVFEELGNLEGVGAVIVTGGGENAFMAGADIKMIRDMEQEDAYTLSRSTQSAYSMWLNNLRVWSSQRSTGLLWAADAKSPWHTISVLLMRTLFLYFQRSVSVYSQVRAAPNVWQDF
jgi:1,4-dihydroxy-2-naphthoyl-CoA synthase